MSIASPSPAMGTSPPAGQAGVPECGPRNSDPVRVITLGCRLNAFESELMRQHAEQAGLDNTFIVNTCAVTSEAVRQASQAIRKLKRENPAGRIIVSGCAAQIDPQRFAAMPEVDHVIGNAEKIRAATFSSLTLANAQRVLVNDIRSARETAHAMLEGFHSRVRAYVEVQNGCDHRCTFCIIPYGRGPSRSVPAGAVVAQVRRLIEGGCREVVLTGVDITSYGADLPGEMSLGRLVRQILRHVPELERLRLSSIDQSEIDRHLLDAIAEEPRLMPHLHLSLQSGDDLILKRMKRRHSRGDAVRFCNEVRRLRPDVVFGADLIAGFPTETEAAFVNSLSFVDDCELTYLHVFPFSPRPGTPAARMPAVPKATVKQRAARLRRKGSETLAAYLQGQIGTDVELMMEQRDLGRTPGFAEMRLESSALPGTLLRARVTQSDGKRLRGVETAPTCVP